MALAGNAVFVYAVKSRHHVGDLAATANQLSIRAEIQSNPLLMWMDEKR